MVLLCFKTWLCKRVSWHDLPPFRCCKIRWMFTKGMVRASLAAHWGGRNIPMHDAPRHVFPMFAQVTLLGILPSGIPCNACPRRKGSFRKKPRKWLERSSSQPRVSWMMAVVNRIAVTTGCLHIFFSFSLRLSLDADSAPLSTLTANVCLECVL